MCALDFIMYSGNHYLKELKKTMPTYKNRTLVSLREAATILKLCVRIH